MRSFNPNASDNSSYADDPEDQKPPPPPPRTNDSSATTWFTDSTGRSHLFSTNSDDESKDEVDWSSGLCDCFSDRRNCCITFWCPCVTFGQIAEILDKGSSSCGVNGALYTATACCCYSWSYRSKLRQQYGLRGTHCRDCLVHCFCECCSLCQEHRELKKHGFDFPTEWDGSLVVGKHHQSMEKASRWQSQSQSQPPIVEEPMSSGR